MAPTSALGSLAQVARAHHGVFSVHQARDCGVSKRVLESGVRSGILDSLYQGVYCFGAVPLTWRGHLLAACWAGGMRAYASHRSAAAIWGLPGGTEGNLELTCPRWRRARHGCLIVHETKVFVQAYRTVVDAIPISTVARTLLDLGAVTSPATVERAVERALLEDLVTLPELWATVRRLGMQGRNGVGVLRQILLRRGKAPAAESEMEVALIQALRARGLPEPVRQHVVVRGGAVIARVDLAYPQWRIAIEYNSIEHHANADALVRDGARQNAVAAAGFTPIVATVDDLRDRGRRLADAVRAIARRSGVTE